LNNRLHSLSLEVMMVRLLLVRYLSSIFHLLKSSARAKQDISSTIKPMLMPNGTSGPRHERSTLGVRRSKFKFTRAQR